MRPDAALDAGPETDGELRYQTSWESAGAVVVLGLVFIVPGLMMSGDDGRTAADARHLANVPYSQAGWALVILGLSILPVAVFMWQQPTHVTMDMHGIRVEERSSRYDIFWTEIESVSTSALFSIQIRLTPQGSERTGLPSATIPAPPERVRREIARRFRLAPRFPRVM